MRLDLPSRAPRRGLSRRWLLGGLALAAMAPKAEAAEIGLKLGTSGEGGGFAVYADAFIDAIKWANQSITVKSVPTRGSVENVPLLQEGKIDIGLVFGEVAQQLFNPTERVPTNLKVISTVYASAGMFVVRADTRYRSIEDLKGRPVIWNGKGSALALQGRYIVEALGFDPDKDFEAVYIDRLTDGPAMILEGRASALWGAGNRWPGFVTIASDARGARFITPTADQIDRIVGKHAFMQRWRGLCVGRRPAQGRALQQPLPWPACAEHRPEHAGCAAAPGIPSGRRRALLSRNRRHQIGGENFSLPAPARRRICCRGNAIRLPVSLPARPGSP